MKTKIIFLSLFIIILNTTIAQNANKDQEIVIGNLDKVYSNILNENRNIWVYVPNGPNPQTNDPEPERFPVIYLLDGNGHFFSTMGILFHLSHLLRNTPCPKMIIVGIPNTNRNRDLTPSHAKYHPALDSTEVAESGGGENFLAFIEKELIPHIDSLYPTAPYRMFIGHSFGGLTVMNALINHTDLFNSYVAIDPSMSWDDQKLLKQSKEILKKKRFQNKSLFIAQANNLDPNINSYSAAKDFPETQLHIESIKLLHTYLKENNNKNGLRWKYKYYEEETHGSSPLPSEYDAFKFIFDFYRFNSISRLNDPKFNGDSAIVKQYENISKNMGYKVLPPEPLLNDIGYGFVTSKHYNNAYAFLKMNLDNHPKSWNCYDSMGDLYKARGENQKAIEYYNKALLLNEWPDTREKLNKLLAQK